VSENTSDWLPLVFESRKLDFIPFWVPGSHVWVCARNNVQFLQGKPGQDEQDPSGNSEPWNGSASACNIAIFLYCFDYLMFHWIKNKVPSKDDELTMSCFSGLWSHVKWVWVTKAQCIFRLQMEEIASRYSW
jgi:hypothetical protein